MPIQPEPAPTTIAKPAPPIRQIHVHSMKNGEGTLYMPTGLCYLDEVVPGKMAVRLLTSGYAVCPFARVTSDGKAAGVFLLNAAAGDTPELKISLRNPAYKQYRLQRQMAEPVDLKVIAQSDEEIILEIPSIAPWRAVFIEGVEK